MNRKLQKKYDRLTDIVRSIKKICIAYSGGVDSTLLVKVCVDTLGKKHVLAVTAVSETYPSSDIRNARQLARETGVKHIILKTPEMQNPDFTANTNNRCYFCKKSFFKELLRKADEYGFTAVCDGSNTDDQYDYRPGRKAAAEFKIRSPLMEAGMNKKDIRALSRKLGLSGWDRPANPCLASRIPYGTPITKDRLIAVEKAEDFLHSLGFRAVRVRSHGRLARIELPARDIAKFMRIRTREAAAARLKKLGFIWISIDIEGYRTGSMNEIIMSGPQIDR